MQQRRRHQARCCTGTHGQHARPFLQVQIQGQRPQPAGAVPLHLPVLRATAHSMHAHMHICVHVRR